MAELIPLFGIFFVIGVPVMAVATKFVLQPLLRELTQAVRGGKAEEFEDVRERVARLEGHLLTQARQLDQLVEAEMFRRQLEVGPADAEDLGTPEVSTRESLHAGN